MPKIAKPWVSKKELETLVGGTWTPAAHTHEWVDITDFGTYLDQAVKQASSVQFAKGYLNSAASPPDSQFLVQANSFGGISMLVWSPDNLYIGFDIYWDGSAWKSLDAGSNFDIVKGGALNDRLVIRYDSGVAIGSAPTMNNGIVLDTAGNVGIKKIPTCALDVNGTIKATEFYVNLGGLLDVNLGALEEGETIMYDQGTGDWIDAWGVEYDNPRLVWKMYTDFFSAGTASNDPWVGAVLINGTMAARAGETNHPGQVRLNSGSSVQSGYRWMTATDCILLSGAESSEFVFKSPINLSDVRIRLGFQDSLNDTAPTDGMYIDINGTTLKGITRNNGAETVTGTTEPISTSTWYRVKCALSSDKATATFWLYSEVGTQLWSNTTTTNIPTGAGRTLGHGVVAWIGVASGQILIDLDMMVASQAGTITR